MLRPTALLLLVLLSIQPKAAQSAEFLDPNQAFRLAAQGSTPGKVDLLFDIRSGHYMYREAFRISAAGQPVALTALPAGERKFDEAFQREMEIYRGMVRVSVQVPEAAESLQVTGQGCADKGLCYAPMTSTLRLNTKGAWTIQPSADPAGEFGVASMDASSPSTAAAGPGGYRLLASITVALWALLLASRRF